MTPYDFAPLILSYFAIPPSREMRTSEIFTDEFGHAPPPCGDWSNRVHGAPPSPETGWISKSETARLKDALNALGYVVP